MRREGHFTENLFYFHAIAPNRIFINARIFQLAGSPADYRSMGVRISLRVPILVLIVYDKYTMSTISLDYDGTFTADPELWLDFVKKAQARGHEVIVVTMRSPLEAKSIDPRLSELVQVMPTDRKAKRTFARTHGKVVDIWIDDVPEWIFEGSV